MAETQACTIALRDWDACQAFCAAFAQRLRAGDVVLLSGPLAAGKTTFVKAMAQALGSHDAASSPTFAIGQFYGTGDGGQILHIDTYRLKSAPEFFDSGLQDYFDRSIVLVEWGELLADHLDSWWHLRIEPDAAADTARTVRISVKGTIDAGRAADLCRLFP